MEKTIRDEIMELVEKESTVVVCSVDETGYPNCKAMFIAEREGLKTFLFSTNTSSMRAQHFMKNPKASIYLGGNGKGWGLMLLGEMEVTRDRALREKIWVDGCEKYYPLGVDDPDYMVFRFTARKGNYYRKLKKYVFDVDKGV